MEEKQKCQFYGHSVEKASCDKMTKYIPPVRGLSSSIWTNF